MPPWLCVLLRMGLVIPHIPNSSMYLLALSQRDGKVCFYFVTSWLLHKPNHIVMAVCLKSLTEVSTNPFLPGPQPVKCLWVQHSKDQLSVSLGRSIIGDNKQVLLCVCVRPYGETFTLFSSSYSPSGFTALTVGYLCTPTRRLKAYRKFTLKYLLLEKVLLVFIKHGYAKERKQSYAKKPQANRERWASSSVICSVILHALLSFTHSHLNTQSLEK